ncbi:MAG TPA: hypothetical protein VLE51_02150 [Candidatus Saccharimonadales bacterium]|nr:hypothetical protein [Candidatus Saccharimonadales bacterium]
MKVVRYNIQNGVKRQQIKYKKVAIGLVAGLGMIGGAAIPVLAAPPGVVYSNPGSPQATNSNNCIAYYSAGAIHNGQAPTLGQGGDPSQGTRGDEIKGLQASCGAQQP